MFSIIYNSGIFRRPDNPGGMFVMIPEKYFAGKKSVFFYAGSLYRKLIKKSFFNKIFLVYLAITFVSCIILFFTLTQSLLSVKYDQALVMSDQILATVDTYLEKKTANVKSIQQKLYRDDSTWQMITGELKNPSAGRISAYQRQELNNAVIQTYYSIDKDLNGIFFFGSNDENMLQFGSSQSNAEYSFFMDYCRSHTSADFTSLQLVSSRLPSHTSNTFSLFLTDAVRDPDNFASCIGISGLYFNAMNIQQSYYQYNRHLKGTIYIIDSSGSLLYDSSSSYLTEEEFPWDKLMETQNGNFRYQGINYNVVRSSSGPWYIVNAFPMSLVKEDVRVLQKNIISILFLIFILTFLLNYISTKFFAKRIRPITDTMEQVRQGHLTSFRIQPNSDDEIGYIYSELIKMCSSLDDHIQKEYVYQLKQKEMELYALQAQVDPHFLYNTLESIRMSLYMKGETQASKMIRILSDMFRNIMKKDVVVSNREEINYVRSYLELYQFRYGSRMKYEISIADEVYRYATIKHILQPVIENALIHGIQDTGTDTSPSTIYISAEMQGEDILFRIRDDGCGIPADKLTEIQQKLETADLFQDSIGIYNVNSRLRIVYGNSYRLQITSRLRKAPADGSGREEGGTLVTLRIRAMKKKELEDYVQIINRG